MIPLENFPGYLHEFLWRFLKRYVLEFYRKFIQKFLYGGFFVTFSRNSSTDFPWDASSDSSTIYFSDSISCFLEVMQIFTLGFLWRFPQRCLQLFLQKLSRDVSMDDYSRNYSNSSRDFVRSSSTDKFRDCCRDFP